VTLVRRTPPVGHSPESLEGEKIAPRCPLPTINDGEAEGLQRLPGYSPQSAGPSRALHRPRDEMELAPSASRGFFLFSFFFFFLFFFFFSFLFSHIRPLRELSRMRPAPPHGRSSVGRAVESRRYIRNTIACPTKVPLYGKRTRRKSDSRDDALDPHDRSRSFPELILDICNAHIYFFDFIPISSARAPALGLFGNYIRSRRMFLLRIIARATTPIFPLDRPRALLFFAPFPASDSTAFSLRRPFIFQSSSVGVPLKARLNGENITSPPSPPLPTPARSAVVYNPA